ncbi:hypothetical protein LTS08_004679 [Lithohypha guttulata]|nr:hypothetical protein LTS08_004679 [Lithohypha guttulata]
MAHVMDYRRYSIGIPTPPAARAAPTYYTYKDPYPATENHPHAVQIETKTDWPKTYRYNSNQNTTQGIHPPGPVYQANQAPAAWYYNQYYGAQQPQPQYPYGYGYPGYAAAWANGQYYGMPAPTGTSYNSPYYYYQPSTSTYQYNAWPQQAYSYPSYPNYYQKPNFYAQYYKNFLSLQPNQNPYSYMSYLVPGGPSILPTTSCPGAMTAQAAMAAATNASLAAMPQGPNYFVGGGPADFAAQQAYLVAQMGFPKPPPTQLAPYKPADGQQFWCKETDGSWTLRTHSDILNGDVSPGHWERHATSGYFYWVRDG